MPIEESTTFEISTRGAVDDATVERAKERINRVGSHCREPIIHVELRITNDPDQLSSEPVRAEATLSVKRGPVRAHAIADTTNEAVDLMIERLRRRVDRHESRLHREGSKRHDGVASEGHWHHGDVQSAPRHPLPLRDEAATVVKRKTFAAVPMNVEEAAFDLDILDHDFYLFEEAKSGEAALLRVLDDGRYQLEIEDSADIDMEAGLPVDRVPGPALLDQQSAQRLLDTGDDPFVFFRSDPSQPGQVMYRRYDGNYGVVELGTPNRALKSTD